MFRHIPGFCFLDNAKVLESQESAHSPQLSLSVAGLVVFLSTVIHGVLMIGNSMVISLKVMDELSLLKMGIIVTRPTNATHHISAHALMRSGFHCTQTHIA